MVKYKRLEENEDGTWSIGIYADEKRIDVYPGGPYRERSLAESAFEDLTSGGIKPYPDGSLLLTKSSAV